MKDSGERPDYPGRAIAYKERATALRRRPKNRPGLKARPYRSQ
jgi:hypothetical protein